MHVAFEKLNESDAYVLCCPIIVLDTLILNPRIHIFIMIFAYHEPNAC
jgi:hypothetical protein